MKKIKLIAKFMATCVIFSSILTQNVFAESTETDYQLAQLQPYVDELEKINAELGSGLVMCLFTPDQISSSYNDYCSMSVDDFRNYIINLYNNDISVDYDDPEIITGDVSESGIETYGVVYPDMPYKDSQKVYITITGENYFELYTTCSFNHENRVTQYDSFDSWKCFISSYPTYGPSIIPGAKAYDYTISADRCKISIDFYLYKHRQKNVVDTNDYKILSATITAGGGDTVMGQKI